MPETKALITQVRAKPKLYTYKHDDAHHLENFSPVGSAEDRGRVLDVRQEDNGAKAAVDQTGPTSTNRHPRTSETLTVTAADCEAWQGPQESQHHAKGDPRGVDNKYLQNFVVHSTRFSCKIKSNLLSDGDESHRGGGVFVAGERAARRRGSALEAWPRVGGTRGNRADLRDRARLDRQGLQDGDAERGDGAPDTRGAGRQGGRAVRQLGRDLYFSRRDLSTGLGELHFEYRARRFVLRPKGESVLYIPVNVHGIYSYSASN